MVRRAGGVILLLLGTTLLVWVGYNLFVMRLPETLGRHPLAALSFVVLCFYVGMRWIRGEFASE